MKLQLILPPLLLLLAFVDHSAAQDPQTELGKQLREHLDEILEKIKDAIDHGKVVREDTLDKLKEIREKLKDLRQDAADKVKERINEQKGRLNGTVGANP